MQEAIINENLEEIEKLLQSGYDPNEQVENGQTLLFQTENIKILKLLLDYGADPKTEDEYCFTVSDYTDNNEILSLMKSEIHPNKFVKYRGTLKIKVKRGKTKKNRTGQYRI